MGYDDRLERQPLLKSKLHTMIKLLTSTDGQFYFTLCGKNGKVIMTSETYVSQRNRMRGVKAFIRAAKIATGELCKIAY